jgi:Tfp pilus assembly protein PilP
MKALYQDPQKRHLRSIGARYSLVIAGAAWLTVELLMGFPTAANAQSDADSNSSSKKYVFRQQEIYRYSTRGRRDPFKALVTEGLGEVETDMLNVEEATLTGIIWMGDHMVALFKDKKGKSHYMKKGDAVWNGRIVEINDNSVIVTLYEFGDSRRVELKVTEHSSEGSGG